MREQDGNLEQAQKSLYCNCCGEPIQKVGRLEKHMDYIHVEKSWGYFSHRDLTKTTFNMCEKCYEKVVQTFVIPAEELDILEVMRYDDEDNLDRNETEKSE